MNCRSGCKLFSVILAEDNARQLPVRTSKLLFHNVFRSVWRCWCIAASTALHQADYLASSLQRVSDLNARRQLRSSSTSVIVATRTLSATIGGGAFPAAAASDWSRTVRALPSLPVFRSQ